MSHDRHLLPTTCDEFLLVADGQVNEYSGDLDDYRQFLSTRKPGDSAAAPAAKSMSRKEERREAARLREQEAEQSSPAELAPRPSEVAKSRQREEGSRSPAIESRPTKAESRSRDGRRTLEKRSAALEAQIAAASEKLRQLDAKLASSEFYGDGGGAAVHQALAERGNLSTEIEALETEWMELLAELEKRQPA